MGGFACLWVCSWLTLAVGLLILIVYFGCLLIRLLSWLFALGVLSCDCVVCDVVMYSFWNLWFGVFSCLCIKLEGWVFICFGIDVWCFANWCVLGWFGFGWLPFVFV